MNWDAIGAIGEIVGAAAVVATLAYLTVQIRQNTKAVEHSTERGAFEDGQAWLYHMVDDPEVASLYQRGLQNEDLSPVDAMRFRFLMQLLFNHWHHARRHDVSGLINVSDISSVVATPGGSRYWRRARLEELAEMDPNFIGFIDSILGNVDVKTDTPEA